MGSASHETLLAIVAEQQTVIAKQQTVITELRERIKTLEERASLRSRPSGMPGNKWPSKRPESGGKKPRKQRPHGFARQRTEPTRREVHAVESCPECGTGLEGGWVYRTREIIDLPLTPAEVTEHVVVARTCPVCRERRLPQAPLAGLTVGRQRLGINLMSLIVTLREECRLPIRGIQQYLDTVHQLKLSVGAVVEAIHRMARHGRSALEEILERIRGSPVVHADETGWREDGVNGFVWTFSTPTERYLLRRGRGKGVVDEVLGESIGGVLVSDFYAAYNHYLGLKQRCWVHLLRDIHDLEAAFPDDQSLKRWAGEVRRLYDRARECVGDEGVVSRPQLDLEKRLLALCRPFSNDQEAVQAKLCRRIERFIKELFVFVSHPEVPPDPANPSFNNAAERSLRHLVVSRKIGGGTRSEQGTNSKMTLASLFGTWRAQDLNPLFESRQLLLSPQP